MESGSKRILKEKVVDQMLQLEDLFHSRFLTAQLLNEMISSYVEAIQCFDGSNVGARKYFLNKIQFVLSRPEIDGMLQRTNQQEKGNSVVQTIRQTMRMTSQANGGVNDVFSNEREIMEAIESDFKKRSNKDESEEGKLRDRKAKIEMQMKVMREIEENMKSLKKEVQKANQKEVKENKRINALVQGQELDLEERLAMRRRNRKPRKKSHDQRQIEQRQQIEPMIAKETLKSAQKEIQQAVVRMTQRLTERMNLGANTGLLAGSTGGGTGRLKMSIHNQADQDQHLDEPNPLANVSMKKRPNPSIDQTAVNQKIETFEKQQNGKNGSQLTAITDRMTSGEGGKNRIKMKKQGTGQEEEQELMDDDCI